eukprot:1225203-Rhodomonas_salina.3
MSSAPCAAFPTLAADTSYVLRAILLQACYALSGTDVGVRCYQPVKSGTDALLPAGKVRY